MANFQTLSSVLAAAAISLAAPTSAAEMDQSAKKAIAVFNSACAEGEAKFEKGQISAVSAGKLPMGARKLAQISLWPDGKGSLDDNLKTQDLPQGLFALAGKPKTFLASPMASPTNPIQASCSVFTKAEFFRDASLFAAQKSAQPYFELENQMMVSYDFGEFRIFAASYGGWTLLSMVPSEHTNTDQSIEQNPN